MSLGTTASTLDFVNSVAQDFEIDVDNSNNNSAIPLSHATSHRNPASEIQETIKNMTSTSCSYPSYKDATHSHLRLKMSSGNSNEGLGLPGGRSSMNIPTLLQKLPCHGCSTKPSEVMSSSAASPASAVTLSALSVIEKGSETSDMLNDFEVQKDKFGLSAFAGNLSLLLNRENEHGNVTENYVRRKKAKTSDCDLVNLDVIDLDNIPIGDLQGLQAADGDTLRAKHLNNLSQKEREHVLQDIHGVADDMEDINNTLFVDHSLVKFQEEIIKELDRRKSGMKIGDDDEPESKRGFKNVQRDENSTLAWKPAVDTPKHAELEERLGKLQEKLDELTRERNSLNGTVNGVSDFTSSKQLSAKNHPIFGKLGEIGGMMRPTAVPSSCFGGSSSFFSPTTAMAKSSLFPTSKAQEDASILKSANAIAFEQALAQCRGRRRERNNSLFRPNTSDDGDNDDLDEGLYIDVEQKEFRLSFLRAERFDTKKAATRFIDYFEEKRTLFGVDKLTTKIKLKDLDPETKNCLESGQFQILPGQDRAGRAVIVGTKKLAIAREKLLDQKSVLRAFWVVCSIALEDLKTETGVVFVNYAIGGARNSNSGFSHQIRDWGNILRALPVRVASIHWCVDSHKLKQTAYLSALMLGASNFVRVRCHAGSDMEVQYDLNTFGIPTDLLPVSMTGQVNLSRHNEFLRDRKNSEAYTLLNKALALVETPMLDFESDDELPPSVTNGNQILANPMVATRTSLNNHSNTGNTPNRDQFKPYHKLHELNQTLSDFTYSNFNQSYNNNSSLWDRNRVQVLPPRQLPPQIPMTNFFGMEQRPRQQPQNTESKSGISYSMEPVLVPGELDILLGRGRGAQNHKGNIHYRQVVETFRSRYEQIPQKGAKTQLIREVVAVIYDNGGRFLKQDGFGRWIPVDPEVARDKVSHSFRNQKRLSVGATPMESSMSKKRTREEAE